MNQTLERIKDIGIVPVVVIEDPQEAKPVAEALLAGGISCIEVTYRTDAAEESIRTICESFPEMLVGAGTILTIEQAESAIQAGASFLVSPGTNPNIIKYCSEKGVLITPGVSSPTDIEMALSYGIDVVKFFPAEQLGGLPTIKAMSAPYSTVKFLPTGGINEDNIASYMSFHKVLACGGSWMVNRSLIKKGDFEKITRLSHQAVIKMLGLEVTHIGAGISITTNHISRALSFFEKQGFKADLESATKKGDVVQGVTLIESETGSTIQLLQKEEVIYG